MKINNIDFKEQIKKTLVEVTNISEVDVEFSSSEQFGDYSTNVALKNKDLDPQTIVDQINSKGLPFTAKVVGRFINFYIKNDTLVNSLTQIDSDFGKSNLGQGKLAIVEYSSPNIAKPFGVGHLRSTVIGDAVANLMEAIGYKVMRDNHLGDWGTQFGKVICAIKKWGNEKELDNSSNPVEELTKLYVKFHDQAKTEPHLEDEARLWFKKLEDGDKEARRLWQKCVDWSYVEFDNIYNLLDIKFDAAFNKGRGLGESFFESRMAAVISELEDKKFLKEGEDGAKLVFFDEGTKLPPLMILKKDGSTLYATRDLATDKHRLEKYNPDLVINEVGSEQSLYFKQIFETERILGWYKEGQRVHVGHGLFLLDGKKMSTRAGKTVKLDEVLVEAIARAKKLGNTDDEIAKQVGIGAIKYFDLSHHPMTNINFDWDSMFSMDGNSSPYIQYTIARCNSVLAKSPIINYQLSKNLQLNSEESAILRSLIKFPEVVENAALNYSPNLLCNYLYDLASKFNTFYAKHKILGLENASEESFRIILTEKVGIVLKSGLKLLGIESPEKM